MMKLCLRILAILVVCTAAFADPRLWNHNGVPVLQNGCVEWTRSAARDANGMILTTWSDMHSGSRDIYAQLINPAGEPVWGAGVQVTTESHEQSQPVAVATNGGWILAWLDYRNVPIPYHNREAGGEVWMQKLDYNGNPLWTLGGVAIDSSGRVRYGHVRLVSDNAGGATFAWCTLTDGWHIYANRITDAGTLAWPRLSVSVSGYELPLEVVSDGAGGMIVVQSNLAATRVAANGSTPWGPSVRIGQAGSGNFLSLASDGFGGFYAVWQSYTSDQNYNIRAQRVHADGQVAWSADGLTVCDAAGVQGNPALAASYEGGVNDGCVISWHDVRNGNRHDVYYAQKVDLNGNMVWDANGILLCDSAQDNLEAALASDGTGGLVAAWEDVRNVSWQNPRGGQDILALHLNAAGQRTWGAGVVPVCLGARDQFRPLLVKEADGYLVLYENGDRAGVDPEAVSGVSIQKLDPASGACQFSDSGRRIIHYPVSRISTFFAAPMSEDRVAVLWNASGNHYQILDHDGHQTLNSDTAFAYNDTSRWAPYVTQACADGQGGVFAVLEGSLRDYVEFPLLAHIAPDGHLVNNGQARRLWPAEDQLGIYNAALCADGEGGCYTVLVRYLYDNGGDLHVTRQNSNCEPVWETPVPLDSAIYPGDPVLMLSHPQGGFVVEWYGSNGQMRLVRFSPNGVMLWNTSLGESFNNSWDHKIVANGQFGFYLTALRGPYDHRQLWAQRVSLDGQVMWSMNGIALSPSDDSQDEASLVGDRAGNLIVAWASYNHASQTRHIFAQKLSLEGARLWGNGARLIVNAPQAQDYPCVVSDGADGSIVVWDDLNNGNPSVYGMHLTAEGLPGPDPHWVENRGGILSDSCAAAGAPRILPQENGEAVVVWLQDLDQSASAIQEIYAQRIIASSVSAKDPVASLPRQFALYQNYPNPFNPTTEIRFDLPVAVKVQLKIFNTLGQEVATLIDDIQPAGAHRLFWDGTSASGASIASGLYIYQLKAGDFTSTRKMMLIR